MKFEFSAGGIVYKKERNTLFILLAKHSYHKGWVFPKGLIDKGETKEQAAIREVKEESGADGVIQKSLEPITYWYRFENEKRKKTVYYFIMQYAGGDISQHDFEMDDVQWYKAQDAVKKLTYRSEKELLEKSLIKIERLAE